MFSPALFCFRRLPHVCSTALAIASLSIAAVAQDVSQTAKRLPPGVLAMVSVPNTEALRDQFLQTGFGHLVRDPAMQPFMAQFEEKWLKASQKAQQATGASLAELLQLVSGEFTLATLRTREQGLGAVGILGVGSRANLMQDLLNRADGLLLDQGATKTSKSHPLATITVYDFPQSQPNTLKLGLAYCLLDGHCVLGSSSGQVELVLDRWNGDNATMLSQNEHFTRLVQTCCDGESKPPALVWYMTPVELTLAGMSLSPEMAMPAAMATGMLPQLGLNRLKAYGGTLHLATPQHDYISRVVICLDGTPSGILGMFQFPPTITGPPAWIPEHSLSYFGLNWDVQTAYASTVKLADAFLGPGSSERSIRQMAEDPSGPGIHLKKDIIDNLTGIVHWYTAMNDSPADDQPRPEFCVGIGIQQEDSVRQVVAKAIDALGADRFEAIEVDGRPAYLLDDGSMTLVIAVGAGQVVIASRPELLTNALEARTTAAPLSTSAAYRESASTLPAKSSMVSFANLAAGLATAYQSLRSGSLDALTEGEIDFSLLPEFEQIRRYFLPQAGYSVPLEKGSLSVQSAPLFKR